MQCLHEVALGVDDAHALAAAAHHGLDEDGEPYLSGFLE
jgi:hypothetical protein